MKSNNVKLTSKKSKLTYRRFVFMSPIGLLSVIYFGKQTLNEAHFAFILFTYVFMTYLIFLLILSNDQSH